MKNNIQILIILLMCGLGCGRFGSQPPQLELWSFPIPDGSLLSNNVRCIFREPGDAAIWFGTERGASRYDLENLSFAHYIADPGLAGNDVRSIHAEPGGRAIWFGSGRGAARLDFKTGFLTTYTTNDGLVSNDVRSVHAEPGGRAIWFGTGRGASRLDLQSRRFANYTTKDGLGSNDVFSLQAEPGGSAIWFGTRRGATRYDLENHSFSVYTTDAGLASNSVRAIHAEPGGSAIWFGTGRGASRYDLKSRQFTNYYTDQGLTSNDVLSIHVEPTGRAILFGTGRGVSRFDLESQRFTGYITDSRLFGAAVQTIHTEPETGAIWFGTFERGAHRFAVNRGGERDELSWSEFSTEKTSYRHEHVLISRGRVVQTRPLGLAFVDLRTSKLPETSFLRTGQRTSEIAQGPRARIWTADRFGLWLRRGKEKGFHLTVRDGLPSTEVSALSPIPGTDGEEIWIGTGEGAVRIRADTNRLRIERTASWQLGLPAGRVDALAALSDGSVFLAYNADFSNLGRTKRRGRTHVRYLPADGPPSLRITTVPGVVHDVTVSPQENFLGLFVTQSEILWAATSRGLFKAVRPRSQNASFEPVELGGLDAPLHTIKRKGDTIWVISEQTETSPASIIGYHPDSEQIFPLIPGHGIPGASSIDDLDFTDDGELVVLVTPNLYKGRVQFPARNALWLWLPAVLLLTAASLFWYAVFRHPLVLRLRARPETLRELSLSQIPHALRYLRRARAVDELRIQLGLSESRLEALQTLTAEGPPYAHHLRILARLLGMENAHKATVDDLGSGLQLLLASLPDPAPLRDHPVPFFGLDPDAIQDRDPATLRRRIANALTARDHRFELPFVMLCRKPRPELIPEGNAALLISDEELRELLFAQSPQQVFAGLLLTRGLLAISPYRTEGPVKSPEMFFGRDPLLRELITAPSLQFLLVGPRRVGKSSLLHRVLGNLPTHHPDLEHVYLDLLNISDPARIARKLARKLELEPPVEPGAAHPAQILAERFTSPTKPGLLLIDEADALVEADAQRGYPLLSELRSLQAEGVCSFVLTGYWHIYRHTLDHNSPLHNFASVRRLGPLEPEAGRALATEPMARLGLTWADTTLADRIVERTGGYPNLIQLVCHELLEQLKQSRSLTLETKHLEKAEKSSRVREYLTWSFHANTVPAAQVMVHRLLERQTFTLSKAHACLEKTVGREIPLAVLETILVQLVLYGFVVESEDRYSWTIPLLRETLLAGEDLEYRVKQLVQGLPADPSSWAMPDKASG
jgi:ligand-binding sensor domain-containing protein